MDGGYGWVVVFASFVMSLIADGLSFSFGLINTQLIAYFGESPSKTAWTSSLFLSVPLLLGPLLSNLVDKYGCRKMTIIGGLVSAIGFALSSFCNSIEMLMLTFGIISGVGLGIGYVTAVVSIAFWFDKKRTFATGIGASGTGIGTFLYAPLTQYLIDSYCWRGATLILAGTMLHTCVCGALMRDPDWLIEQNRLESRSQSMTTFSSSNVSLEKIKKLQMYARTKKASKELARFGKHGQKLYRSEINFPTFLNPVELNCNYIKGSLRKRSIYQKDVIRKKMRSMSLVDAQRKPVFIAPSKNIHKALLTEKKKSYLASVETLSSSEKLRPLISSMSKGFNYMPKRSMHFRPRYSLNENVFKVQKSSLRTKLKTNNLRHNSVDILQDEKNPKYKSIKDGAFSLLEASFKKQNQVINIIIPENEVHAEPLKRVRNDSTCGMRRLSISKRPSYRSSLGRKISTQNSIYYGAEVRNSHRNRISSCPNIYRNTMNPPDEEEKNTWYNALINTMKTAFDFSLFRDMKYVLFTLSTLLLFTWYMTPYLYLSELTKLYDYDSAQLISVIGIAQTIGLIGLDYLGNRSWININICYSACMIVCGASVFFMPRLLSSYSCLLTLCILFGFTFASSFSLTPNILVSIVDLNDFKCGYGLVLLVQGLGMLAGPPLAGAIYEMTLRWDESFYVAGISIAASGIFSYAIEFCEAKQ